MLTNKVISWSKKRRNRFELILNLENAQFDNYQSLEFSLPASETYVMRLCNLWLEMCCPRWGISSFPSVILFAPPIKGGLGLPICMTFKKHIKLAVEFIHASTSTGQLLNCSIVEVLIKIRSEVDLVVLDLNLFVNWIDPCWWRAIWLHASENQLTISSRLNYRRLRSNDVILIDIFTKFVAIKRRSTTSSCGALRHLGHILV